LTSDITDFNVDSTLTWDGIHDAVESLDLSRNIAELERHGITTVTPQQSGVTPEFVDTVRAELLRLSNEITDRIFDPAIGPNKPISNVEPNNTFLIFQLLAYKIPEFETLLLNPALQTLIGYLLGPTRRLSSLSGLIKWQCSQQPKGNRFEPYNLHADSPTPDGQPVPMAPLMVANSNFLLTDFASWEDGPMVVAPGSHREGRRPLPADAERMQGHLAPKGSIVVFGGALQHGSVPRLNPGMRISINSFFCQPYTAPQEHLQGQFPDFAKRGELAKQLVWQDAGNGWGIHGPAHLRTPFTARTRPDDGYGLLSKENHPNSAL
jgi:ectoine hydroxylase-related dioxygenase (phytanoyl-CoA dioxygenase family)